MAGVVRLRATDRDGDLLVRARIALSDPRAGGVWSTGEQLAVALILDDRDWLAELRWSWAEAVERWAAELHSSDQSQCIAWLAGLRARLWVEAASVEIGWPIADGVIP